jgi:hypothetical protein
MYSRRSACCTEGRGALRITSTEHAAGRRLLQGISMRCDSRRNEVASLLSFRRVKRRFLFVCIGWSGRRRLVGMRMDCERDFGTC